MKQRLSLQNIIGMSFMTFALFLGAGNLIFPPLAGQLAGTQVWLAAAGFLITGVGLPLLAVIMVSRVGGRFNDISRELPRSLIVLMGCCIYTIVVPIYGAPRTGLVAYEIGVIPFLKEPDAISRLIYSITFFGISWYLSLYPGKLLESVGKIITPALILLLIILGIAPIISPLGEAGEPMNDYAGNAFVRGFLEGYMTMDALAALLFSIVIITNLKSHGITSPNALVRHSIITGCIAACGLALVYLSLFNLGTTSRDIIQHPQNGGQILSAYVSNLFGHYGNVLLATVVSLACLTTSIGLITAASEYFCELSKKLNYKVLVAVISISCMMFANLGLNQIIELFIPVLLILYPVCIALILLGLIRDLMPNPQLVYRATLFVTFLLSLVDASKGLNHPLADELLEPFKALPGHDFNLSWVIPFVITIALTCLAGRFTRSPSPAHEDQA
ncbi:branched-chain amino acid transport system II carrier protein [Endozoicomonas numazuensis]|uniref:Branched-chain amino acid transport system carrier protein n=1 Tax=Endozoicomonas numazuensis TaxID=1137799 RepID=A0A081NH98_9GAMM|nr:branched-chain amino acid transport system II carrier protein [Endozoicomonas numazuensis]KEQ17821.1 branched-chain amino acid transporter [Endozoicomonas numazuensis]